MSSIMSIKLKVLSVLAVVSLLGCTGNSETESLVPSSDLKRFSGVINNSSVTGVEIVARPIGKHGKFSLTVDGNEDALVKAVGESGRYHFNLDVRDVGPYVITVLTPEFDAGTESENAAKASCQLALGCDVGGESLVEFGEFYSLEANKQWSAAVETVSEGQYVVINPITEMASVLGSTIYINDSFATSESKGDVPASNYYSNYGIVKGNSQTAKVVGLGNILSSEPANLALLHNLNVNASTSIEESIRYGALLAAWQQLELEYDNEISAGSSTFQQEAISQFLNNQGGDYPGQLFEKEELTNTQVLTLYNWYEVAYKNLEKVRDYHQALNRSVPAEVALVINRFKNEIDDLVEGKLTNAEPVVHQQFKADYADAVLKSKAMVNYLSNLQGNFATEEYRTSIKASSDLITAETRRLAPSLDLVFQKILSIYQYYVTCTHGECDAQSEWHSADGSAGNTFIASEDKLAIVKSEGGPLAGTNVVVTQGLVFDELNPEGSIKSNTHDLFLSGVVEFDGIRLELSDYSSEGNDGIKSSIRFSFQRALEKLPLEPEKEAGGAGVSVDEELVPDYIEVVMPNFKLFSPLQDEVAEKLNVSGSLTALMIANVDPGDEIKVNTERLGKRYNLANVKATLRVSGQSKGEIESQDGVLTELRDNALFFIEASASESFISSADFTAYFPDTVYPTFEAFFKPRKGFEVGKVSPFPLVKSRLGTMNLPALDIDGEASETEEVQVSYIELDYEIGGLERYIVYPELDGDDGKYWGLICAVLPEDEEYLEGNNGYTRPYTDDDGKITQIALFTCPFRDKYEGDSTPDDLVNQVYSTNKNLFNLREYNGHGAYRIEYPLDQQGKLEPFQDGVAHSGRLEIPLVLGIDSMRLQFKPNLVSQDGASYLPESILDVSLVWRTHEIIDVNVLMAFDSTQVINNPNGSGLPYLAVGSESESYSVAYRTEADGTESGEYVMAWAGVEFVDGPIPGGQVMQKTDNEELKQSVLAGIGSNVSYSPYSKRELDKLGSVDGSDVSEEKCGFFSRGLTPAAGEDCDAIAYLTYRGLVTGSLREERDGVYVIRYIDGSWQVLGAN